jgi:hypothetical protein
MQWATVTITLLRMRLAEQRDELSSENLKQSLATALQG